MVGLLVLLKYVSGLVLGCLCRCVFLVFFNNSFFGVFLDCVFCFVFCLLCCFLSWYCCCLLSVFVLVVSVLFSFFVVLFCRLVFSLVVLG